MRDALQDRKPLPAKDAEEKENTKVKQEEISKEKSKDDEVKEQRSN